MGAFSKFFQDHIKPKTCQELLLHDGSCITHCIKNIPFCTISCFKHFAPICLTPALFSIHKMDRKKFKGYLKYYILTALTGAGVGNISRIFVCLLRHLFGQFNIYTMAFWPSFIGAFAVLLGPSKFLDLGLLSVSQCMVDIYILGRKNAISRILADSQLVRLYIFMACGALILQGKRLYNINGFWLLMPNPKIPKDIENRESNKCELHKEDSCNKYLIQGLMKYFGIGLILDILKALTGSVRLSENQSKLLGKIKNFRPNSMALMTSYVGIYRFMHCYLNRHFNSNHMDSLNHLISSFMAGFAYYLSPQPTLFSCAIAQAIRTLWIIVKLENENNENSLLNFLFKIPFRKILPQLFTGILGHYILFKPHQCTHMCVAIIRGLTANYGDVISKSLKMAQERVKSQYI